MRKKIFFIAAIILVLLCTATACIFVSGTKDTTAQDQFAVAGGIPYYVKDGELFQSQEGSWVSVDAYGEVRKIVSGEDLCGLDSMGNLFYECDLTIPEGPLSSQISIYMGQQLAELNQQYSFADISSDLLSTPCVLLENGIILFPIVDDYVEFQLEETPAELAEDFVLTREGNIYYLKEPLIDDSPRQYELQPTADLVYSAGDIVSISACYGTGQCLGLTDTGNVVSLSINKHFGSLPVSEWTDAVSVIQGFHFAVALTSQGNVLYADYDEGNTAEIQAAFSSWKNIVAIAIYGMEVYGLKADGSWVSMEITL